MAQGAMLSSMRLLLCSEADEASVNIRRALLQRDGWRERSGPGGMGYQVRGEDVLASIPGVHLFADDVDRQMSEALGVAIDAVVFLSRHKAASGIPTLTVHPIGNFAKASYGGRDEALVPALPDMMTSALRGLQANAVGLGFQVSFEVTHHGPYLTTPTMYIEIGSSEANWGNREAADAIARTLVEGQVRRAPKAIGVGGGHYAPRFSEVVVSKRVSFGHMIPSHFADHADDDVLRKAMALALEMSQAEMVYVHKKSMSRARATHLRDLVRGMGAEAVDSSCFEDL
jgi:D-aminoacyl-tRNA deacylase